MDMYMVVVSQQHTAGPGWVNFGRWVCPNHPKWQACLNFQQLLPVTRGVITTIYSCKSAAGKLVFFVFD